MNSTQLLAEVNEIFDKDDVSKFRPHINYFIAIAAFCTAFVLLETIHVIAGGDKTLMLKIFAALNIIFIAVVFGLYSNIKKEFRFIRKNIRKSNRNRGDRKNEFMFDVSYKSEFIIDAETIIKSNASINYALVHYDLNKFSIINNSVGYKKGDEILRQIGKVLTKSLKNEIIGKAEGDNFFVLLEYEEQEKLIKRACEISDKIEKIGVWNKLNLAPVVKTGIYFIDNENLDVRVAIDKAYFAKVNLKSSYKSGCAVYEDSISDRMIEIKTIENDMHKALKNGEFVVYLQPKVDLQTGNLSGAEALVRWVHPEMGLLSPIRFIPVFENNGFIVDLDKFVFEEVCSSIRKWIDSGYNVHPVSVNVSRSHFTSSNFVSEYRGIRDKYRIADGFIEIEITESVVFSNKNESEIFSVMRKFRDDGFEISMDDFGSGYSSLGLLKEMPIDTLKLDKMFLSNIEENNSKIIVSNIVNMAKNLKLNVVCEGVETSNQVDFLKKISCDMAQGFIFEKPKPMDEYEELINKEKVNYYKLAI